VATGIILATLLLIVVLFLISRFSNSPFKDITQNIINYSVQLITLAHSKIRLLNKKLAAKQKLLKSKKELSLVNQIDKAHRELEQARAFFEEAKDPALIDYAIYAIEAAERKYIYLLKIAQQEKKIDDTLYKLQESRQHTPLETDRFGV